jgi:hypothetical protein
VMAARSRSRTVLAEARLGASEEAAR